MRRLLTALAILSLLAATGPRPEPALAKSCPEYCGERAAAECDDIESFECGWYILGCLAGCNIARL